MRCPLGPMILLLAVIATPAVAEDRKIDPATLKDKLSIKPGETFVVHFEPKGDRLTNPKKVDKPPKEPTTPTFAFSKAKGQLMLMTRNPYSKNLKFRALMRVKGSDDFVETSIFPVIHGLSGLELWQDPIEELILFDFRLVAPEKD